VPAKPLEKPIPDDTVRPMSASSALIEAIHSAPQSDTERLQATVNANTGYGEGLTVGMPNRGEVPLSGLIDHDYVAEQHTSIFADAEKWLKDPLPEGAMVCFPAIEGKTANKTFAMERRGYYRRVTADMLRDDIDVPIYTHKSAVGEFICVYDVCMMIMPADVARKLRSFPRQGALLRAAHGAAFKEFAGRTRDLTGGAARAQMTATTDDGRTTTFEE
jgi:hypothetical protein